MNRTIFAALAALFSFAALGAENPYGVCAHVSRDFERDAAQREYELMKGAGIEWVRTDFDWSGVEKKQGEWDFAKLDDTVKKAADSGIKLLPILVYDVMWAAPAWKHQDKWLEYVRRTVGRYAKELRHWEVYNEQNSAGFWHDAPSGANYAEFLKNTYKEIKKIDPKLTVLYGGTSGVPLKFIEDSFAAGAGKYFDVMCVHPYGWYAGKAPEDMVAELDGLRALMAKHKLSGKPVWLTEMGFPTFAGSFYSEAIGAALVRAGIEPSKTAAAAVRDFENGFPGAYNFPQRRSFGGFKSVEYFTLEQLKSLDPKAHPVLIPTLDESFPSKYFPHLVKYVKNGGTLLLPINGLPFYHDVKDDGLKDGVGDKYSKQLRMAWETSWKKKGVPEKAKWQKPAPEFEGKFKTDGVDISGRFLTAANAKNVDEFIPVVEAGTDSYKGASAAIYKLGGDFKGNVIVFSCNAGMASTEEMQAQFLVRTHIIALAKGVEKTFWYNFRAAEWSPTEPEDHFGVVRKDLEAKPALRAWKVLAAYCPPGSSGFSMANAGQAYIAGWKEPGGKKVWALWGLYEAPAKLALKGRVERAADYMGEAVKFDPNGMRAGPSVIYIVGPESLSFIR